MTEVCIQENTEPPNQTKRRYAIQYLLVFGASIAYFVVGGTLSWPNVLQSQLFVDNSTLFGNQLYIHEWEMDLLNSLIHIGAVFGLLLGSWIVPKLGRKKSLTVAVVPGLIGWTTIGMAYNTYMLLIARFCDGIATGIVTLTAMTYATEIPDTAIRGTVISITTLMFFLGTSVCIGIGIILTWYHVALLNACLLLLYIFFIVPFLPESPTFLIVTEQEEKATKVLKRLRGTYINIKREIRLLKKMNDDVTGDKSWSFWLQRNVQKRILVLTMLLLVQGFSGTAVLRANAVRILHDSGVTLNKDVFATCMLMLSIAGVFLLLSLVDRFGRRICLVISLGLMMLSYVVLGIKAYLQDHTILSVVLLELNDTALSAPHHTKQSWEGDWWITVIGLIVCNFAMNIGIDPLPWQLSSEYFPTTIRSQALSLCLIISYLIAAVKLQLYSFMNNTLTTAGLFGTYAVVSAIGVVFSMLCVPETARMMVG